MMVALNSVQNVNMTKDKEQDIINLQQVHVKSVINKMRIIAM